MYVLSQEHKGEWVPYGGEWSIADGLVENGHTDPRGAKIMTGSGSWANYTLQSDIRFEDERGDMGLILRSHDEDVGIDAYDGYYVGLRMDGGGVLLIGRSNYGWIEARRTDLRRTKWQGLIPATSYSVRL